MIATDQNCIYEESKSRIKFREYLWRCRILCLSHLLSKFYLCGYVTGSLHSGNNTDWGSCGGEQVSLSVLLHFCVPWAFARVVQFRHLLFHTSANSHVFGMHCGGGQVSKPFLPSVIQQTVCKLWFLTCCVSMLLNVMTVPSKYITVKLKLWPSG
jgi:hypothetical protein